jgi:RNA polymerase sigma-70 factor (ECF subfamily)
MSGSVTDDSSTNEDLLLRARRGDQNALGDLLAQHRERLRRMVQLRMDRRLQGRIDPSDIIQEAFLEAATRFDEYTRHEIMPFFLWLRFITGQKVLVLHRRHLGTKARDARREVSLFRGALPEATSESLAAQLLGRLSSPSHAAIRAEMQVRLQETLNGMDEMDREILALRHFEQLSCTECAQVLDIDESAASSRYYRALKRLKEALSIIPGFFESAMGE